VRAGIPWPELAAFNHLQNPNLIFPGQVIKFPPPGWVSSAPPERGSSVSVVAQPVPAQRWVSHYSTPPLVVNYQGGGFTGVWACIARYESGGNASTNTGNGYYGGLQFTLGTWAANGGSGNPANASAAEQQRVAENVVRNAGGSYGAWPNTSRMCGV
jgi:hypothetical protein